MLLCPDTPALMCCSPVEPQGSNRGHSQPSSSSHPGRITLKGGTCLKLHNTSQGQLPRCTYRTTFVFQFTGSSGTILRNVDNSFLYDCILADSNMFFLLHANKTTDRCTSRLPKTLMLIFFYNIISYVEAFSVLDSCIPKRFSQNTRTLMISK